jgi:hypothetical protein
MFLGFFFLIGNLRKFLGGLCDWYQEEIKLRNGIEYKLGPCLMNVLLINLCIGGVSERI